MKVVMTALGCTRIMGRWMMVRLYHEEADLAQPRHTGPYIWVTALTKLLTSEDSCEWASWFRAHHEKGSWQKVRSDFDSARRLMEHTDLLRSARSCWDDNGAQVFVEGQNAFNLRGNTATLGGRPDLVVLQDGRNTIVDAKTGQPKESDKAQVMAYMWAMPLAFPQYRGLTFDGLLCWCTPITTWRYRRQRSTDRSSPGSCR